MMTMMMMMIMMMMMMTMFQASRMTTYLNKATNSLFGVFPPEDDSVCVLPCSALCGGLSPPGNSQSEPSIISTDQSHTSIILTDQLHLSILQSDP